jgi:subtilisin family serine protease
MQISRRSTILATALVASVVVPMTALAAPADDPAGPAAGASDTAPGRVVVQYLDGVDHPSQVALERAHGASRISEIPQLGVHVLSVPAAAEDAVVAALARSGRVAFAEPDVEVHPSYVTPNDPEWTLQWGPRKTSTHVAWETTTGASDVTIAILDTGLTPTADFDGKVLPGRNVLTGTSDVTDANGHGTRVASIAGAATDNATGIAGYCWQCKLLPVKVMESSGWMSDVAKGVVWATDNGADVVSMSLGGSSGDSAMQSAVQYAASRNVLLVAAAGNSGSSAPMYPAAYAEVIAVAGSTKSDTLYSWSNYGSWVDVAAPGSHQAMGTDGTVWSSTGTSSATPAVAGIAGLALSLGNAPTATQVRSALQSAAVSIGSGVRYGRVDAAATLAALGGAPAPTTSPEPSPVAPTVAVSSPTAGQTVSGTVTVKGSAQSNDGASISRVEVSWAGTTKVATGTTSWSVSFDTTTMPEGTSRITATATTSSGAVSSASVDVVVQQPTGPEPASDPALSVSTGKIKGQNVARLSWSSDVGSNVTVLSDGKAVAQGVSGTTFEHRTGTKGGHRATYQVCGSTACSAQVLASW